MRTLKEIRMALAGSRVGCTAGTALFAAAALLLAGCSMFSDAGEKVTVQWVKSLERDPGLVLGKLGSDMQARLRDAANLERCSCRCRMLLMQCLETDRGCSLRPEHAERVGQILTALREGNDPPLPVAAASEEELKLKHGIGLDEAKRLHGQDGVIFVDARSRRLYDMGHIPGAVNVSPHELEGKYLMLETKLKSARATVIYCGANCGASVVLTRRLLSKGIDRIRILADGWDGWAARGFPESRSPVLP